MVDQTIRSGDITATAQLTSSPGEINLRVNAERSSAGPVGFTFLQRQVSTRNFTLNVRPSGIERLSTVRDRAVGMVADELGTSQQILLSAVDPPSVSDVRNNITGLGFDNFELLPGGSHDVSDRVTFQPIPIPDIPGVDTPSPQDIYNDLPATPSITVTLDSANPVSQFLTSPIVFEFDLPADAFFEIRDVDFECGELYEDIQSEVNSIEDSVSSSVDRLRDEIQEVNDVHSRLERAAGGGLSNASTADIASLGTSTIENLQSRIESIDVSSGIDLPGSGGLSPESAISSLQRRKEDIRDEVGLRGCRSDFISTIDDQISSLRGIRGQVEGAIDRQRTAQRVLLQAGDLPCSQRFPDVADSVDSFRDRAVGLTTRQASLSEVRSLLDRREELEGRVNDIDSGDCADEFMSSLEQAGSNLRQVQNALEEVEETGEEIRDTVSDLGCSDVRRDLRTGVSGIEQDVQFIRNKSQRNRSESRIQTVIDDANSLQSDIRSSVSSDNPCRDELLSRLSSVKSTLQGLETEASGPRPCFEKFPNIENRVDNFERSVIQLGGSVSPQEAEQVRQQADQLVSDIESVDDQRCRERMGNRVESALGRLGEISSSVSVRAGEPPEQRQQREQQLDELREELTSILNRNS